MAGKRGATSDLNHDNWDREDEPEDAGTFKRASEDSLRRRVMKTAKRRNPISSVRGDDADKNKSAFTGFMAFAKAPPPSTAAFSFLTDLTKTTQPKTNGNAEKSEADPKKPASTFPIPDSSKSTKIFGPVTSKDPNSKSSDYYSKLKGLNESVSNWIKKHVDTNPLINLQPIFKDYEKYFKELEEESNKKDEMKPFVFNAGETISDNGTWKPASEKNETVKELPKFIFGSSSGYKAGVGSPTFGFSNTATSNTFSFASSNISTTTTSTISSSFSFGSNSSKTSATTTGFSFSASTPITFGNVAKPVTAAKDSEKTKDTQEDDEDSPPKVEFTPVVEKDHIFTTRCKVFVKKDGNFSDRGVGNLYLKPIENSEKVQLIVRADTSLGNLLCNFILSENIPTKRMGKKDVMLVCLPTPEVKPPPVPILLRVKSSEEADTLLETLDKYKK